MPHLSLLPTSTQSSNITLYISPANKGFRMSKQKSESAERKVCILIRGRGEKIRKFGRIRSKMIFGTPPLAKNYYVYKLLNVRSM